MKPLSVRVRPESKWRALPASAGRWGRVATVVGTSATALVAQAFTGPVASAAPAPAPQPQGATSQSQGTAQSPSGPLAADSIAAFGSAQPRGAVGPNARTTVVGMTATPSGRGYWLVASDGGIFTFGDASFYGSTGGAPLARPIVGMTATPSGRGYWLVASDGGIFTFGDASFYGSTGGAPLARPIVGMAATPSGRGYWLVASDGGIFTFGDASFTGSGGSVALAKPIVSMAATPSGRGYWLVASDGGVLSFGDATFRGAMTGRALSAPVVGMAATPTGRGYWMATADGGVLSFGDAGFRGSLGATPPTAPVVGVQAAPDGGGYWLVTGQPQPAAVPLGTFSATCYDLRGSTATGAPVSEDVVAVDPSVIPLGTRLYIVGIGERTAADTGGAIRGARLDIWEPSAAACVQFGRQSLQVYRLS